MFVGSHPLDGLPDEVGLRHLIAAEAAGPDTNLRG